MMVAAGPRPAVAHPHNHRLKNAQEEALPMAAVAHDASEASAAAGFRLPAFDSYDPAQVGSATVTVTPDLAKIWMQLNERNRPESEAQIAFIAGQLKAGEFDLNGETVKFAYDLRLLDGQTRLEACIRTGISFPTVVVWGLDHPAQETVDIGRKRTAAHTLAMRDYTDPNNLAAAVNLIWAVKNGTLHRSKEYRLTPKELYATIDAHHAGVYDALKIAYDSRREVPMTKSAAAALRYLVLEAGRTPERSYGEEFWTLLVTGEHSTPHDPVWVLRERLHAEAVARAKRRGKSLAVRHLLAFGVIAWNRWSKCQPIQHLVWKPDINKTPQVNREVTRPEDFRSAYPSSARLLADQSG
jgi:hypothetical protein